MGKCQQVRGSLDGQANSTKERFWELDVLRGLAVLSMIGLHLLADMDYLKITVRYNHRIWNVAQTLTAGQFLLLAGVSLALGSARLGPAGDRRALLKKQLHRGAGLFAWGMLITFVTKGVMGEGYVVFGVLHLIGFCILLSYPLLGRTWFNLGLGLALIGAGIYVGRWRVVCPWLLWLGVIPAGFHSVDYFPVLPWAGPVILGIFLGHLGYPDHVRRFPLPDRPKGRVVRGLGWLGRHSFVIYLVHQPVLLLLLKVLTGQ